MSTRLLGGLLVAALLTGCATGATDEAAGGRAEGEPVPVAPACEQLPERGAEGANGLPPLTLPCLGPGADVALQQLTGRPTLVNLWATWCLPCREEMPMLQEAHDAHGDRIRFLGVNVQDDPHAARWFLDDLGTSYPHVVDSGGDLPRALGVRGLPLTLVVDHDGRVVDRWVGQLTPDGLQQLVDRVVAQDSAGGAEAHDDPT